MTILSSLFAELPASLPQLDLNSRTLKSNFDGIVIKLDWIFFLVVVDNAPKSWAAITQGGPKGPIPTAAPTNQKPGGRPPMATRPEPRRPSGSGGPKSGGSFQSNEDGYGGGYRNGGNGGQRSAGSGSGGQDRHFEFPRLQTEEADAFPDFQQVYIRDIPTTVSSTSMHKAMQGKS